MAVRTEVLGCHLKEQIMDVREYMLKNTVIHYYSEKYAVCNRYSLLGRMRLFL